MRCNFRTLFKLINIINQTNIHNPGSGCQKLTLAYQNKEGINKTHNKRQISLPKLELVASGGAWQYDIWDSRHNEQP